MADQIKNVSRMKFHPVFGGDIRAALEVTMPPDTELVVTNGELMPELVYRNALYLRVYNPAVVEGNLAEGDQSARIIFTPWVDESAAEYYSLVLWGQAAGAKNFSVHFGRFGEDACFIYEPSKKFHIHLDFFGKRKDQFIPLYARVRDRRNNEVVNLLIEGVTGETADELLLRRVEFSELPPCLQHLRTQ